MSILAGMFETLFNSYCFVFSCFCSGSIFLFLVYFAAEVGIVFNLFLNFKQQ